MKGQKRNSHVHVHTCPCGCLVPLVSSPGSHDIQNLCAFIFFLSNAPSFSQLLLQALEVLMETWIFSLAVVFIIQTLLLLNLFYPV